MQQKALFRYEVTYKDIIYFITSYLLPLNPADFVGTLSSFYLNFRTTPVSLSN